MRVAVLSPHRDDAAFSCSLTMHALLQAGAALTVVNVYTQSSYAVDLTTIDGSLPPVQGVSEAREREDQAFIADAARAACREPEAIQLHDLQRLDAPLRLSVATEQVLASPLTTEQVAAEGSELAPELQLLSGFDVVFAPLALGDHIDHRVAREAARLLLDPEQLCWYEDLPYAARITAEERKRDAVFAVASNAPVDFRRWTLHLPQGPHLKTRFAMHYPSQIAPEVADEMADYAKQWSRGDAGGERWWAVPVTAERICHRLSAAGLFCNLTEEQQ